MMAVRRPETASIRNVDRPTILLVEDEPDIASVMRLTLERAGLDVEWCGSGEEALERLVNPGIGLVLLDVILPGIDGHAVCQEIRSHEMTKNLQIIMVTSLTEEPDLIVGLGLGADDYVRKPFSGPELVARAKAALRRRMRHDDWPGQAHQHNLSIGQLEIDASRHACSIEGKVVPLTMAEYRLLQFLMSNPGRAFTRQELLPHVVGKGVYVVDRNIDVHIRNLRRKIVEYAPCVVTVRGVGYRFDAAQYSAS
ncbi:MAG: DNA-binding response OmpR family regulator [Planctomycetota bacterium]|jgi:DNA-binding response OmpR family regulator